MENNGGELNESIASTYSEFERRLRDSSDVFQSSNISLTNISLTSFDERDLQIETHNDDLDKTIFSDDVTLGEEINKSNYFKDLLLYEINFNGDENAKRSEETKKSDAFTDLFPEFNFLVNTIPTDDSDDNLKEREHKHQQISFKCPTCSKEFSNKINLKAHQKTHSATRQRFPCEICSKPFVTKEDSKRHENTHMNSEELKTSDVYHEICKICDKVFFNKQNYKDHVNKHNNIRPFTCPVCVKTFVQKGDADNHLKTVHSSAKDRKNLEKSWKFSCETCNKKFRTNYTLKRHKLSHSEKKDLKCNQCDRNFTHKFSLTKHVNSVHLKLKKFVCGVCMKSFSYKHHLKRHLKCYHKNN